MKETHFFPFFLCFSPFFISTNYAAMSGGNPAALRKIGSFAANEIATEGFRDSLSQVGPAATKRPPCPRLRQRATSIRTQSDTICGIYAVRRGAAAAAASPVLVTHASCIYHLSSSADLLKRRWHGNCLDRGHVGASDPSAESAGAENALSPACA